MYDLVHKNKRLVQAFLALLILPFAFVGVDSYVNNMSASNDVATVGGRSVTDMEFENALRMQQDRMRGMLGQNYDPAMFDNPEVRQQILDGLVNQQLMAVRGQKLNLTAPDEQLRKVILEVPEFQANGQFSAERYDEVLRANGMSRQLYEQRLRSDLAQQPLQDPLVKAGFVSTAQVKLFQRLTEETRGVQYAVVDPSAYVSSIKITDEQIKAEYEKNPDAYRSPEQIQLEYVELSQANLLSAAVVTADDLKTAYNERQASFTAPEERRASHILLSFDKSNSSSKETAKVEADTIIKELNGSAEKFAAIAKAKSKDGGSAEQGGDLGYFGRGQMVKPFEDAVFAQKKGEIVGPIESDFGYHIILLTDIKAAHVRPFDEVKAQLETELKQQRSARAFSEAAEKFQNRVYEQSDSYQDVAKDLGLTVKTTDWLTRAQVQALAKGNERFAQMVFSSGNLSSKRNSEAMDLGDNDLISARVTGHKPSAVKPLDEVKAQITNAIQKREATLLAIKAGEEKLAQAKSGNAAGLNFSAEQKLSRQATLPQVNAALTKAIFALPADATGYAGGENNTGGYTVVRVGKLVEPEVLTPDKQKSLGQRLIGQESNDIANAYLGALKEQIKVEIKKPITQPANNQPPG